jgi:hypothetical protein
VCEWRQLRQRFTNRASILCPDNLSIGEPYYCAHHAVSNVGAFNIANKRTDTVARCGPHGRTDWGTVSSALRVANRRAVGHANERAYGGSKRDSHSATHCRAYCAAYDVTNRQPDLCAHHGHSHRVAGRGTHCGAHGFAICGANESSHDCHANVCAHRRVFLSSRPCGVHTNCF